MENQSSSLHTKGPWATGALTTLSNSEYPGLGRWFIQIRAGDDLNHVVARVFNDDMQAVHDDASRIVACVNACEGISTEALEQKGMVPVSALEAQRDQLLAVLEIVRMKHIIGAIDMPAADLGRINKIIAECKGGAA